MVRCNGHTVGNPSLPKLAECIGINRNVWSANAKTDEERFEERVEWYLARAHDQNRDDAESYARRKTRTGMYRETPLLDRLETITASLESDGSGGGMSNIHRFHNLRTKEMLIYGWETKSRAEVDFTELQSPMRRLRVSDGSSYFHILLTGTDYVVEISQLPKQQLKLVMVFDQDPFLARVDNIIEFRNKYEERYEQLVKILEHVGLDLTDWHITP